VGEYPDDPQRRQLFTLANKIEDEEEEDEEFVDEA
jgi:hypothetical protein